MNLSYAVLMLAAFAAFAAAPAALVGFMLNAHKLGVAQLEALYER